MLQDGSFKVRLSILLLLFKKITKGKEAILNDIFFTYPMVQIFYLQCRNKYLYVLLVNIE